jgi:serine/threonine-protein kinase
VVVADVNGAPPPEREEERHWGRWVLAAVLLGLIVGLLLSQRGAPKADVPNVVNQDVSDARTVLQVKGFDVETETVHRIGARNTVLEQDPPGGKADQDCDFLKLSCTKPTVTLTVNAGPASAQVPSLSGLTVAEATAKLRRKLFEVGDVTRAPSDSIDEGLVVSSDPRGGTSARQGSAVSLVVSSGAKKISVPLVVGEPQAIAEQEIRDAGLVPSATQKADSGEAGQVLSQSPDAGNRVDQGSTVAIVVSKGAPTSLVPNVIGRTRSSAVAALRAKGFVVSVSEQQTDVEAQDGKVVDQFPTPGGSAKKGSTVTIFVGNFTAPTPPPTTPTTPTVPAPRR